MPEVADTCSLASPASVCRTQHLHLRCSVDFARRVLTGTAALTVQSQEDNLRSLVRERLCSSASPGSLSSLSSPLHPASPEVAGSSRLAPLRAAAPLCQVPLTPSSVPLLHLHSVLHPPRRVVSSSRSLPFSWTHPSAPSTFCPSPTPEILRPPLHHPSAQHLLPPHPVAPLFLDSRFRTPPQVQTFPAPRIRSLLHSFTRLHILWFKPLGIFYPSPGGSLAAP